MSKLAYLKAFIFPPSLVSLQHTLAFLLFQQWSLVKYWGTSRVTNHSSLPAIALGLALEVSGKLGQLITLPVAIRPLQMSSLEKCFVSF